MIRIGVDIGGTFTDATVFDDDDKSVAFGKALTTPDDLVRGVLAAIDETGASVSAASVVIHGSTIAINALLERKGARTALLTTRGFRDVYEIGRINRPDSFNLFFKKHQPLVPRELIFEVDERMQADGTAWLPLQPDAARASVAAVDEKSIESVAVVFLHSYRNPDHELQMREALLAANPDLFISVSAEISREYREYERTSTAVANAFIGPTVSRYLGDLQSALQRRLFDGAFMIMQSSGGLYDVESARRQCIHMLESGPAGGVVGASALCEALQIDNAICFDMGGTTAKAAVVQRGVVGLSPDYFIGNYDDGLAIRIPVVDIKEVGTGGGSIAWLDRSNGLHVGPQSAGADPGPAAYGRGGTDPTITDAQALLGRLPAERFMGGKMPLALDRARDAFQELAARLSLDWKEAAAGVLAIANAAMADAVRAVTTERGLDPRDFVLIAYGGGGPLHAASIARELGITQIVIPHAPGLFSALGMLMADLRREYVRTQFQRFEAGSVRSLEPLYADMEREAFEWLQESKQPTRSVAYERAADMRYVGQEHAVTIPVRNDLHDPDTYDAVKAVFDRYHETRFGHAAPAEAAEIVSLRVTIVGVLDKPAFPATRPGDEEPPSGALRERRSMYLEEINGETSVPVYDRAKLEGGNRIAGPAIVEEAASSTLVPRDATLFVSPGGHLLVTMRAGA